jgi:hypothetical protein
MAGTNMDARDLILIRPKATINLIIIATSWRAPKLLARLKMSLRGTNNRLVRSLRHAPSS